MSVFFIFDNFYIVSFELEKVFNFYKLVIEIIKQFLFNIFIGNKGQRRMGGGVNKVVYFVFFFVCENFFNGVGYFDQFILNSVYSVFSFSGKDKVLGKKFYFIGILLGIFGKCLEVGFIINRWMQDLFVFFMIKSLF